MSFGAGHMQDMNNRMKQNRAQRPSNRGKFKENNRDVTYADTDIPKRPLFHSVPVEELNKIKMQIREKAKEERTKMRIFYGLSITLGLILLTGLLLWLS